MKEKIMEYEQTVKNVQLRLAWLNANARHAIELQATFTFPAYDKAIRKIIRGTNNVRCFKICLEAIYVEFIMTLMRMYDTYKSDDTVCFELLFEYLSDDFVQQFEKRTQRKVKGKIQSALKEYKSLNGSHLVGRLKTVRNKMFAHTSMNFDRNKLAEYEYAEKLLGRTLPMLNELNSALRDEVKSFDRIRNYWKSYAIEFWQALKK